jgi:DNA invertase Pin-like site-specific DNA recombinase
MERVALYARVSTKDRGQDPETQLRELREWAARHGAEVVEEYVDHMTGSKADRAALKRLLADAHRRRFDGVMVWALDRLSREGIRPMLQYIETLQAAGVRLRSLRESWVDTDSPVTPLMTSIFAWVAEQERRRIAERVAAGMKRAQREGTRSGRAIGRPRALTNYHDLVTLRTQGLSVRQIAKALGIGEGTVKRGLKDYERRASLTSEGQREGASCR